jgi:hypothetical protein
MSGQQKAARQPAAVNSTALPVATLEAHKIEHLVWRQTDEAPALRARWAPFGLSAR